MTSKRKHSIQHPELSKETSEMIAGTYIDWGQSKEYIWTELEKRIETRQPAKKVILAPWLKVAMAATFALLIGVAAFMQLYTKNVIIPSGMHSQIYLPDQSLVKLNAQTVLSYKPLMWRFSREVKFEGEAYFKVQPGKKFEVISGNGSTFVLGTQFNVYSRDNEYQVTCISGSVKVTSSGGSRESVLLAGQMATLNPAGKFDVQSGMNTDQILLWHNNMFSFTSKPLSAVFEEIGRQYAIRIVVPENLDHTYTGTFRKDTSVENALNLVCKPFSLTFTRKSNDEYVVSGKN